MFPFEAKRARVRGCYAALTADQVTVLRYGAREDREVNLPIGVDRHDAHDRLSVPVAGEDHLLWDYPVGGSGIGEERPAEAVVVIGVEVCD